MVPSNTIGFSRAPRRFVEKKGRQTTVTRRSAPARLVVFPQAPQTTLQVPLEITAAPQPAKAPAKKRFSFSPSSTLKNGRSLGKAARHRTLSFDESSDSSGDESDSSYNSFVLDLKKKDILRTDSLLEAVDPLNRSSSYRSTSPTLSLKSSHGSQPTTYRVLKSRYEGDLFRNSKLSAHLIVGPNKRPGQPEYMKPLFKWVHLENPEMNFGAYIEYVIRCPYLDDSERDSVGSILRTAREKSDQSLRMPPGMKGSYIEPEYFEEKIDSTVYRGPRSKQVKKEVVRWLCIPYFYLKATSSDHSTKPPFTRKGCISEGKHFQVAQFWCLMLGDGLIISCARVGVADIPGKLINLVHIPPADPSRPLSGERAPILAVSDGGIRLWLLPLSQCETWSAFVANFIGLGFSLVDGWEVKYKDVVLDSNDWDTIVSIAKKTAIRLELCRNDLDESDDEGSSSDETSETEPLPASSPSISVQVDEQTQTGPADVEEFSTMSSVGSGPSSITAGTGQSADTTEMLQVGAFHVFTLLATEPITQSPDTTVDPAQGSAGPPKQQYRVNEKQLQQDLSEADIYLSTKNSREMESKSYTECPPKTTYQVENSISSLRGLLDREEFNNKLTFARAAKDLFEFFLPLRYEHPLTLKFWGGLNRILQTRGIKSAHGQFAMIAKDLSNLAKVASEIKLELFSEKDWSEFVTTVPHEFIQAWMMLIIFIVMFSTDRFAKSSSHIRRCKERFLQGRLKMIERLQPVSIREREAVLPLGLTVLILGQLLHDSQGPLTLERHRLTSFYWDSLKDFKQQVDDKPLSRKYEGRFTTLKTEFETIIGQLEDQQRVLVALEDSINESESHSFAAGSSYSKPISMEPSREVSVTDYLLNQTEEMLQNFGEMSRRLTELENWHFLCLSIDTDKQNKASFVFTTVTVFFLPISTLASILGMNTNDIRNMTENQWLFWAVAVPLCIFSLSIWLVYFGSFERFSGWTKQRKEKRKHA
ncbi:uncharacterized protein BDR25DRAFT_346990 [Lindgomyces ingoldianus]|uniref:Uncharacterized protein n=1 Tax=Lindgomyces ingoldianus TaxID=673940 RepID=A0ACB6QAI6_9PLEO|nr:uncharacterized protein BDR25DRAFT_346990 [Lindgomyces ingoldianus]KAF2463922.1 hypothetical protein BDR25DRAFT_346990 [Lindgomyces ingoldianus]